MAKRFEKEIKTAEQQMAFEAVQACKAEMDQIDVEIRKQFAKMSEVEGKYAIGKETGDYIDPHFRPWHYVYATEEDKTRENEEIKAINLTITALQTKKYDLMDKHEALEDKLCITLWGYGIKTYQAHKMLKAKRKALEEKRREIAELEQEIKALENEVG